MSLKAPLLSRRDFLVGVANSALFTVLYHPLAPLVRFGTRQQWSLTVSPLLQENRFAMLITYAIPASVTLPVDLAIFTQAERYLVWLESVESHTGAVEVEVGFGGIDPGGGYQATLLATDPQGDTPPNVPFTAPRYPGAGRAYQVFVPLILRQGGTP
jgi:hypothetical protein